MICYDGLPSAIVCVFLVFILTELQVHNMKQKNINEILNDRNLHLGHLNCILLLMWKSS